MDTAQRLLIQTITKQVVKKLIAKFAFLAWGPLSYLLSVVVEYIITETYEFLNTEFENMRIEFRNEQARKEFSKAAIELAVLSNKIDTNSKEYKDAEKKHAAALVDLLSWRL